MAERSLNHNATMEETAITAAIDDRKRGMRYGLAAFFASLLAAGVLGYLGLTEVALGTLGTAVLGAVAVFVNGRMNNKS